MLTRVAERDRLDKRGIAPYCQFTTSGIGQCNAELVKFDDKCESEQTNDKANSGLNLVAY